MAACAGMTNENGSFARMPIAADHLIHLAREWLRFLVPLSGKTVKVLVAGPRQHAVGRRDRRRRHGWNQTRRRISRRVHIRICSEPCWICRGEEFCSPSAARIILKMQWKRWRIIPGCCCGRRISPPCASTGMKSAELARDRLRTKRRSRYPCLSRRQPSGARAGSQRSSGSHDHRSARGLPRLC